MEKEIIKIITTEKGHIINIVPCKKKSTQEDIEDFYNFMAKMIIKINRKGLLKQS